MTTEAQDSEKGQARTSRRRTLAPWSGIAGAVLVAVAILLIFSSSPSGSGANGAQTITDFYATGANTQGLLIAEPVSIFGGFFLLWFLVHLATKLGESQPGAARDAILGGGVTFVVLTFASLTTQTTMAGAGAFYSAFEVDPFVALAFSHLGYVLLAGAMVGAAVVLAGSGGLIRRGTTLPRWLGGAAYVLLPLSIASVFFVYLPAILFLLWIVLLSINLLRKRRSADT